MTEIYNPFDEAGSCPIVPGREQCMFKVDQETRPDINGKPISAAFHEVVSNQGKYPGRTIAIDLAQHELVRIMRISGKLAPETVCKECRLNTQSCLGVGGSAIVSI
jgi:hypothetical protein